MADSLEQDIQRYVTIWTDIKNRSFTQPLPPIDINEKIANATKEISDSLGGDTRQGELIFKHLDTLHKITKNMHYYRAIYNTYNQKQRIPGADYVN